MTRSGYSDPGTGTQYSAYSKRIINKNGSFNVRKIHLTASTRNIYQYLIQIDWGRFIGIIFFVLIVINALFALIYFILGPQNLHRVIPTTKYAAYLDCFFFSFQTFTTVGYGNLFPSGIAMNIVSSCEAIFGWMSFAIITGLLYGRFSRPSARLMYSEKALIAPYGEDEICLQFRIANMRRSNLMEMEATVLLMTVEKDDDGKGIKRRKFHDLELERNNILFFPLNWTIVHVINDKSPLNKLSPDEMRDLQAEVLIMIKGFDDTFSQQVHSRYSYLTDEIQWGARFVPTYNTHPSGDIHLFFDKFHQFESAPLAQKIRESEIPAQDRGAYEMDGS